MPVSNFALTTASRLPRPAAVIGTWKRSPVTTPAMVEPAPLTVSTPVEPAPSAVARDAVEVGGEEIYPTELALTFLSMSEVRPAQAPSQGGANTASLRSRDDGDQPFLRGDSGSARRH
jgi:hypothetical protein